MYGDLIGSNGVSRGLRFNAPTLRIDQRFGFAPLPSAVCQAIAAAPGTIGLDWEMLGYSYRDAPLYYQQVYLPPNKCRLEVRPGD